MERINKFLAKAGFGSRRSVEDLIVEGKVTINGQTAGLSSAVTGNDVVKVEGREVSLPENIYLLVNKPKGFVTTMADPHASKKITDLLPEEFEGVFPVGRLDKDTTGLLMMTNDGDLAYRLTHPKFQKEKEYLVKAKPNPGETDLKKLRKGIILEDGPTQPAKIERTGHDLIKVTITEGRNRQIRRMFEAVGSKVVELKRTRFSSINLGDLNEGSCRLLTPEEIKALKK